MACANLVCKTDCNMVSYLVFLCVLLNHYSIVKLVRFMFSTQLHMQLGRVGGIRSTVVARWTTGQKIK